jgi:hypothetical protein
MEENKVAVKAFLCLGCLVKRGDESKGRRRSIIFLSEGTVNLIKRKGGDGLRLIKKY